MAAHPRSLGETLLRFYKLAHERLLKAAEDLPPEEFAWSAGPSLHSVAWQLWHAARWDDVFASYFQSLGQGSSCAGMGQRVAGRSMVAGVRIDGPARHRNRKVGRGG